MKYKKNYKIKQSLINKLQMKKMKKKFKIKKLNKKMRLLHKKQNN